MFWLKKLVAYWLMPVPLCLVLLTLGLGYSARRKGRGRGLIVAGTLLLLLVGNKAVSNALLRPLEMDYPAVPEVTAGAPAPASIADCRFIVVLGGGNSDSAALSATNRLATSSLERIVEASRLARILPSARLVLSGPGEGGQETHAQVLARAAVSLGVDRSRITLIETARDTEEEAMAAAPIVGSAPVALVTSAWHMPRAVRLFRKAGVHFTPCPADYVAAPRGRFHWYDLIWDSESVERSTLAVHEWLGLLWVRTARSG